MRKNLFWSKRNSLERGSVVEYSEGEDGIINSLRLPKKVG